MLLAKMSVVEDARSSERREIAGETTLRLDEKPCPVAVFNLSTTGCLVRAELDLSPGTIVRIGLPGAGAFPATVVRWDGMRAGCQFHEPLSPKDLEAAFQSEVVIDGAWTPEPHPDQATGADPLSARRRLAVVVGLSGMLWGLIALGAMLFI